MIPYQPLERITRASKQTEEQLRTIEELEGSIDEKVRAVIRPVVVDEIDGVVKQLKMDPRIDLDNPTRNTGGPFSETETWIEGYPTGIIYQFRVHTAAASLLRRYALTKETSSMYLPIDIFMKMISDLKASITKGEMDQQIKSRTESIIYTRMGQVEATYIPEWRKQTESGHQQARSGAHTTEPDKWVSLGKLPPGKKE